MSIEDILEAKEIQANIIPGFKMPHQAIVGCSIAKTSKFGDWLESTLLKVTFMDRALRYHRKRLEKVKETGLFGKESFKSTAAKSSTWINLGFSSGFMSKFSDKPSKIDEAFQIGLAGRSSLLGDPVDPKADGNPQNWKIGGPANTADMLIIIASDNKRALFKNLESIKAGLLSAGIDIIYDEVAERLNDNTEHFGFKDGISQPEPRGSTINNGYLTPREVKVGNEDPDSPEYASPGKVLVWPGQFVFGYQKQDPSDFRLPSPVSSLEGDIWLKNGSLLVFRRLRQDVSGFYSAAQSMYNALIKQPSFSGMTQDEFIEKLVGRKKDGTPLVFEGQSSPDQDANNFYYQTDTPLFKLDDGKSFQPVKGDPTNTKCPMFAHTRKVNPRDNSTDQGGPRDTLTFRILRRGIPFGSPFNFSNADDPVNKNERGLLFLSYQTSIQGQFELLVNKWMNVDSAPEVGVAGFDMLVGQNPDGGADRQRYATFHSGTTSTTCRVNDMSDHITPTGGGYFFVPSRSALKEMTAGS